MPGGKRRTTIIGSLVTSRIGPLASRNFRLLMACTVISLLGSGIATVALPFAVLAVSGSASDVGFVAAAQLAAMAVFLLWGGVIADRLPRHQVIMAADALQAVAQALSAILVLTGSARIWELVTLATVRGTGFGFYLPAAQGLLPQTVSADHLGQANAMNRVGTNTAQIGGAALGGVIVGLIGPGWGLVADAASFAIAAAMRAGMRFPPLPTARGPHINHQLREGWHEFISRRWLWAIVLQFSLITPITFGTLSVLGPIVSDSRLGGAGAWGSILTAYAIGAVLCGIVMIKFRFQRMLLAGTLAVMVFAALIFALAVPLAVPFIVAAAFLAGASSEIFGVGWVTTMQQEIPPNTLSRVSSYDLLGSTIMAPVGTAVAGSLAAAFGSSVVLAIGGFLVIAFTLPVLLIPEVRSLRRKIPGTAPSIVETREQSHDGTAQLRSGTQQESLAEE